MQRSNDAINNDNEQDKDLLPNMQQPQLSIDDVEVISEHWPHHFDFIFACVGYAVGFGAIWRFPYLCYTNGGGAFLVPYLFFVVFFGIPLYYLELAIGQYSASAPLTLWRICPLFKGVGYIMVIISAVFCIHYIIILAWVLYYLSQSFTSTLPWSSCSNAWNTCFCVEINNKFKVSDFVTREFDFNSTSISSDLWMNVTRSSNRNEKCANMWFNTSSMRSATQEYWTHNVLEASSSAEDSAYIRWQLLLCLAISWIMVFLCIFKGVKLLGKVVYFTASVPYLFLIILLIRNCLLPGSWIGIKYYITPVWSKLLDFSIWKSAAMQVFFALGPCWGGTITMASFNKFNNNVYRDAIIIPAVNVFTCLLGGFVIFSVIGFMAHTTGKSIDDVVEKGPGLVFVAYPEAIAQIPGAPVFSVLFFFMLVTIGLDSQFGTLETVIASIIDEYPKSLRKHRSLIVAIVCIVEFMLGLPLITRGGIYLFIIMDWFIGSIAVCVIALCELIVVCYIYGVNRFCKNIQSMIGSSPSFFWKMMWCCVTPFILVLILVCLVTQFVNPTYGDYKWPMWILVFGWTIACAPLLPLPVVALYQIYHLRSGGETVVQRIRTLVKPTEEWNTMRSNNNEVIYLKKLVSTCDTLA